MDVVHDFKMQIKLFKFVKKLIVKLFSTKITSDIFNIPIIDADHFFEALPKARCERVQEFSLLNEYIIEGERGEGGGIWSNETRSRKTLKSGPDRLVWRWRIKYSRFRPRIGPRDWSNFSFVAKIRNISKQSTAIHAIFNHSSFRHSSKKMLHDRQTKRKFFCSTISTIQKPSSNRTLSKPMNSNRFLKDKTMQISTQIHILVPVRYGKPKTA